MESFGKVDVVSGSGAVFYCFLLFSFVLKVSPRKNSEK